MPLSLPKVLSLFSCLIDLKEMPIDKYNRQLLPESKSTQMGNPACVICKNAMLWPYCSLFSFKALLYFRHLCYFSEIMFFKALSAFIALYFIHGAFIFWQRAFAQVFLSAGKRFIIALSLNFISVSAYFLFF